MKSTLLDEGGPMESIDENSDNLLDCYGQSADGL
jgi:hypothetical protein